MSGILSFSQITELQNAYQKWVGQNIVDSNKIRQLKDLQKTENKESFVQDIATKTVTQRNLFYYDS